MILVAEAYFKVEALYKRYGDFVLEGDLSAYEGEQLAILGPSGAGKSTLLRLIAGLEKPDRGSIYLKGKDLSSLAPQARGIGMVFQDFALFPHLTVEQNIAYGLVRLGKEERQARVQNLLQRFSLKGFNKRSIADLSGGEKQRVALARALAVEPGIILFDEPLASLDAALRKRLRQELRDLQRELGFTSLLVTHDQEDALASADRIALLRAGKIVRCGSPEEVYQEPQNLFTASFVGEANFLISANTAREGRFDPQEAFLLRPEDIELQILDTGLSSLAPGTSGLCTAQVLDTRFQGRDSLLILKVDSLNDWVLYDFEERRVTKNLLVLASQTLKPGTRVSFPLPESRMQVLKA